MAAAPSAQGLRDAAFGGIVADEPQEGAPPRAVAGRRYWRWR